MPKSPNKVPNWLCTTVHRLALLCAQQCTETGGSGKVRDQFLHFLKMKISNLVGLILSAKLCPPFSLNLPPYFIFICLMTCNHYIIMIAFICYFPSTRQFSFGSPNPVFLRRVLAFGNYMLSSFHKFSILASECTPEIGRKSATMEI